MHTFRDVAKVVAPGPVNSSPQFLTVDGNRLYFMADNGAHGVELHAYVP